MNEGIVHKKQLNVDMIEETEMLFYARSQKTLQNI